MHPIILFPTYLQTKGLNETNVLQLLEEGAIYIQQLNALIEPRTESKTI